jgi:hypothetical protein
MNTYLVETLKAANLDVAVAAREGKIEQVSKLPSIEALRKALGVEVAGNGLCNGSCADPVESIKEKFTSVIKTDFQFEKLKSVLGNDKAFNIVCNGSCAEDLFTDKGEQSIARPYYCFTHKQ